MGHSMKLGTRLQPIPLHADRGISLARGEGSCLWDDRGRRYLDLMTNYGVNLLGHAHPQVTAAIDRQAALLTNSHRGFNTAPRQATAEATNASLAAVIIEPIQGDGGIRVPADGYLKGLRELCTAHGALLICDEIQTGFRTGAPLAFTREGIVPDILCLSKSIAN